MSLESDVGLVLRMALGLFGQGGKQFAVGALRLLGMGPHGVDQRSLSERARREVQNYRHPLRRARTRLGDRKRANHRSSQGVLATENR